MKPETHESIIPKENFLKEIVKFTLIALVIVIPLRTYVAQPFIVKGESMDPTFVNSEYLIVDQLTYHFNEPKRGDVVIFRYPSNPRIFFIKRVIGLPGESLSVKDGKITVVNKDNPNGLEMNDPYVDPKLKTYDNFQVSLKDNEYFVMGDNRSHSSDSRVWGPLERNYIVGRPLVSLFPLSRIAVFPGK